MSSEHIEVRRLVDSIMKLMKPLLNRAAALPVPSPAAVNVSPTPTSTPEVAVVRQWQQGKGVVVLEEASSSTRLPEKKVEKIEKKKEDRLLSMLRDAPKPEKIGMALFGMQVYLFFLSSYFVLAVPCLLLLLFFLPLIISCLKESFPHFICSIISFPFHLLAPFSLRVTVVLILRYDVTTPFLYEDVPVYIILMASSFRISNTYLPSGPLIPSRLRTHDYGCPPPLREENAGYEWKDLG